MCWGLSCASSTAVSATEEGQQIQRALSGINALTTEYIPLIALEQIWSTRGVVTSGRTTIDHSAPLLHTHDKGTWLGNVLRVSLAVIVEREVIFRATARVSPVTSFFQHEL
ncbi:unnamed protein product [Calypogeia fissa]